MTPVTDTERLSWQFRALALLGTLMDRAVTEQLPPLQWTIGTTGELRGQDRGMDATERAAERAGMGVNEYIDRLDRGLLFCYRCQAFHPAADFGADQSRVGGKAGSCRRSVRAARQSRLATTGSPASS